MPEHRPAEVFERWESRVRSYCRSFPVVFDRAGGHHLWDTTGRRYTDLLCGAGSLNYGHNPPRIVRRVAEYLLSGGPVQSLDLYTTAKAEFLRRFAAQVLVPKGLGEYVMQFPGPAGTLAVEAALKLARKTTGRSEVVAFRGGFHGASLGSLAATTSPLLRGAAGTHLPGVRLLPYDAAPGDPDPAAALEYALLGPGRRAEAPAAILLETVQGEGGLNVASRPWLARVRRIADEVGALVIVDDVQAGCGRTGTFFSFEHVPELRPDLVCLSKSLSGMGLPLAMVLIRQDLDRWAPGEHNGTFRGQNLAFVGATAALDYWSDPDFVAHVRHLAAAVRDTLRDIVAELPEGIAEPAGRGAMSGLRFADAATAERVRHELFRASVIAETSGDGRVLKLLPPLTMSPADWREVGGVIGDVVIATAGVPAVTAAGAAA
ncbi:diaminobutyrate-2-oxoglutarate transaminase [Thermocatellispora tengchongensis]|uniref:Diaminobutyrate--2-oxoglutarate transaminase n=1 Tax=Thermocatellispora tengchongensis TaxID=1073253 RepID=A0A840P489_9ACTN|nr:diaminobutyrate--2-oxoglutarate transaminase [Thermocatellispora tengchongensis]MBB5132300.1 diaminobutyrate-2-oxoglutarate transaminase [Thermocatellispora tengchongensis]